mgnify:CR=1 FL=1
MEDIDIVKAQKWFQWGIFITAFLIVLGVVAESL